MHFYNISISLTANTFLKKSEKVPVWCQFSLHLRNTIDFLRPFLLELEKYAFPGIILCKSSMYIFMGFKELLNFRTYILKKKQYLFFICSTILTTDK